MIFVYKALSELCYDVAVEFFSILIETSGQITAKQQNIKLELQQLAYPKSSDEAKNFKIGVGIIFTFF